jgi:hypothetical protein
VTNESFKEFVRNKFQLTAKRSMQDDLEEDGDEE